MKKPNGPVDGDKGDRQEWVVDNREPADFQCEQYFHVQVGVFQTYRPKYV